MGGRLMITAVLRTDKGTWKECEKWKEDSFATIIVNTRSGNV